jgi:hypothetical protein
MYASFDIFVNIYKDLECSPELFLIRFTIMQILMQKYNRENDREESTITVRE